MEIRNALSTTAVRVPRDGVLIQTLPLGAQFKAGEPVAWLLPQTQQMAGREMLCYVTYNDLRKLKIGQQVQATPANLERENWGYAYGQVVGIEQYPTTRQEIVSRVKLDPLAAFIKDGQAMYEVRVTFDEQNGNLVWSREPPCEGGQRCLMQHPDYHTEEARLASPCRHTGQYHPNDSRQLIWARVNWLRCRR